MARRTASEVLVGLTAAGVFLSAVVHLQLWTVGYQQIDIVGPLFLLNAIGGLVIGLAVLAWRHWLSLLAAVGFGVATLVAYVVSLTVGLFGVENTFEGTQEPLAAIAELIAVVCGIVALLVTRPPR